MTVCWTIIELMFLFLFFKLPTVTDNVKSQYEQHLECSHQQKHSESSGTTSNGNANEVEEKSVTSAEGERDAGDETSLVSSSIAEQEKTPLLTNDSMKDVSRYSTSQSIAQSIQKSPEDTEKHSVAEPEGFLQKAYWTLYGQQCTIGNMIMFLVHQNSFVMNLSIC